MYVFIGCAVHAGVVKTLHIWHSKSEQVYIILLSITDTFEIKLKTIFTIAVVIFHDNFLFLFLVPRLLKNYVAFEIIISKADHCFIKRIISVSPEKFICRLFVCIFDKNKHCVDSVAVDKMIKQSLICFVLWAFWSDPHILHDCVPLKAPYSWYVC